MLWLTRYWKPALCAVVLIGALTASYAAGHRNASHEWELKYATLEKANADKLVSGYQAAMKVTHDLQETVSRIRSRPVNRVLCIAPEAGTLPGAGGGAGAAVGDRPGVPVERDYGPALRELLAGAAQLNRLTQTQ
jgi:hypothetical protein